MKKSRRFAYSVVAVAIFLPVAFHSPPTANAATKVSSAASGQTVAVMPFRDLSGSKGSIGEAIRETVTTDLKDISGMKVIERGSLDRVLSEQKLQGSTDFDPATSARLGKLLGATMIVTGAYQRAASSVRLTARFVKVETGEIVGTAKVDGANADFLKLQDRVTAELLQSAGIEKKTVARVASRPRPKMKSLRAVEIYGDALVEADDGKRADLLRAAVKEEPQFVYAVNDLSALEQRLKAYDSLHSLEVDRGIAELKRKLGEPNANPMMVASNYMQFIGQLMMQRKWRRVAGECRSISTSVANITIGTTSLHEFAQGTLVLALQQLGDYDGVLHEGEKFLATYPAGMYFAGVRAAMDQSIDLKRDVDAGVKEARDEIATLSPAEQANTCRVGMVYNSHKQYALAKTKLEECLASNDKIFGPGLVHQMLLIVNYQLKDFPAARRELKELERVDPKMYRSVKSYEQIIPAE